MGTFMRVIVVLLALTILGGTGAAVYNAGVDAGLAEAARLAVAAGEEPVTLPVGYGYGPYWHGPGGFGFFGIFFLILGIFLVFGLLRAAFGWGRWGGPGGRHGAGGWGGRREMMEELHRELHRRDAPNGERASGV